MSDFLFTQQGRALARLHAANGYPTYLYQFSVVPPENLATAKGAPHGSEIAYVFGTLNPKLAAADALKTASDAMNAYWRAFATKGDPNGNGLPTWPRYDGQQVMEFTNGGAVAHPDVRNPRLDALSKVLDPKS